MNNILRILVALYLTLSVSVATGQNKIDFWLKDIISRQQTNPKILSKMQDRGVQLDKFSNEPLVNVIIQCTERDFTFVETYGGTLRTVAGPYATALLPLSKVTEVAALEQVSYISAGVKLHPLNDIATELMGIDAANQAGYTGDDVLIGIVDSCIDIKHPGFKNENGTRILYLWDQTESGNGTNEPSYDYGAEWTKEQIDNGTCTSKDTNGHGTHVAGSIAQYIPTGPDSAYDGGAIEANLLIVKTDFNSLHVLDGINYIFERAEQLGKPAIVNLSIGSQLGPHDGTDPVTATRDHLAGPGENYRPVRW